MWPGTYGVRWMAEERWEAVIWLDSDLDSESNEEVDQQQDSGSDRDTYSNLDSSPTLPADLANDADCIAQAEFEERGCRGWLLCGRP